MTALSIWFSALLICLVIRVAADEIAEAIRERKEGDE